MTRRGADWWGGEEALRSFKDKLPQAAEAAIEAAGEIETVQNEEWSSAEEEKWAKESVILAQITQAFGAKGAIVQFRSHIDNPDRADEINDLIHKVENPETVQTFEEARGIARRLHEFTGVAVNAYFALLVGHILKTQGVEEVVRLAKEAKSAISVSDQRASLKEIDPLTRKIARGLGGCLAIDQKLEELGWSDRSEWPDPQGSEDPTLIKGEAERRAAVLEEREGLNALSVLREHVDSCSREIEEVSVAIEEARSEEWDGFGIIGLPLTYAMFLDRLRRVESQLHFKRRVFRRLVRDHLGSSPQAEEQGRNQTEAALNNELSNAHEAIKRQRKKIKTLQRRDGKPSREALKRLIDESRYPSSNKANFAAVGRELGVRGKTAKRWIRDAGLLDYAEG